MNGIICIRKSEPTPASALFTPSGAVLYAAVTRPAVPGEGETHWELELAISTTGPWYVVAGIDEGSPIDISQATYLDTTLLTALTGLADTDPAGMYTLFPSMKFGITDDNKLIGAGSWEVASEPKESRIWFSPVLGSDDRGDDERWNNQDTLKQRIDTSEKNGGSITSILGPVNGIFWTMKLRQVWRHTPTGSLDKPYLTRQISTVVGSISHKGSVLAEDVSGNPAGYFTSHRGFYRLGSEGLVYMGRDIEDVWKGKGDYDRINLSATIPAHGVFHTDEAELYFWVATGDNDTPNLRLRCNIKQATRQDRYGLRGGWSVDTGSAASAYCSCLFADEIGDAMSLHLKPYIGRSDTTIYQCDTGALDDAGVAFQTYVKTKSIVPPEALRKLFEVKECILVASAGASPIRLTLIGDYGINQKGGDRALDAKKDEPIVIRKFGAPMTSEQGVIQVQIGDAVASASYWEAHSLLVPVAPDGER